MTSGDSLDKWIVKAKGLAPYVVCLFSAVIGMGMFSTAANYAVQFPVATAVFMWLGVGFSTFGLIAMVAWHVRRIPKWFQIGGTVAEKKPAQSRRGKAK